MIVHCRIVKRTKLRLRHRLTLVSAKAGAGKTTLVSECLHHQERPATWLALDANDNDPRRFFHYLVASLQQMDARIGPMAASTKGNHEKAPDTAASIPPMKTAMAVMEKTQARTFGDHDAEIRVAE
jgi:ATP/maltotriose-dependent transcriptional regulator MalT